MSKKLLEKTIVTSLASAQEAVEDAKGNQIESVAATAKAYARAQRSYDELMDPVTGTLAKRKLDAYKIYINAEESLENAVQNRSSAISAANNSVANAAAVEATAQAVVDGLPADDPGLVQAQMDLNNALPFARRMQ